MTSRSSGSSSTISGGQENSIDSAAQDVAIGGGSSNSVGSGNIGSTISGGQDNNIDSNASLASISGGGDNSVGTYAGGSTISGGGANSIGTYDQDDTPTLSIGEPEPDLREQMGTMMEVVKAQGDLIEEQREEIRQLKEGQKEMLKILEQSDLSSNALQGVLNHSLQVAE